MNDPRMPLSTAKCTMANLTKTYPMYCVFSLYDQLFAIARLLNTANAPNNSVT